MVGFVYINEWIMYIGYIGMCCSVEVRDIVEFFIFWLVFECWRKMCIELFMLEVGYMLNLNDRLCYVLYYELVIVF